MRGRYLKPNHTCETLQHAIFYDTETDAVRIDDTTIGHKLKQGWAAYVRRNSDGQWGQPLWFKFTNIKQFWAWVFLRVRPKTRLYMFCHNTNFDLPVLDAFKELPNNGWVPDRLVIEAPPTIIRVRKGQCTLVLLDTLNYWPVSLAQLGESVGLPKLTMPDNDASDDDWDVYNRRDVEIILSAVTQWADLIQEYDLGGFQPTVASQAFSAWRHRFMHTKVLIDSHTDALRVSRECYHGGRVEAYHIGKLTGTYHLLDINSMYPEVMQRYLYPTILRHYSKHVDADKLRYLLRKYHVCAHVRMRIDHPAIGIFRDNKYIFPVGEFTAYLTTPELQYVQRHGQILNVFEVSAYERANLFSQYVKAMYGWRLEYATQGNTVRAAMFKTLLNSLYGKFGQRGIRFEEEYKVNDYSLDTWSEVNFDTGKVERFRKLMGVVQKLDQEDESANSHPAIAAHVTAYSRMLLWYYICKAGRENVFYCDTDSLLVNDTGLAALRDDIDKTTLGKLKHEGTYDKCEIFGSKDYLFGHKFKSKGVRASALWTSPNTVEQERWSGLKGLLRSGQLDMPLTSTQEKTLSREYNKARVHPDGTVTPFVLG